MRRLPVFLNGTLLWTATTEWRSVLSPYEPKVGAAIRAHLAIGGTFVDVGAHHGLWSLYAAKIVGRGGRVVSFEPGPAFDVLSTNVGQLRQVKPVNAAVGETEGEAVFFGQGQSTAGSLVRAVTEINHQHISDVTISPARVSIRTLDGIAREMQLRPALVKVDVEGFEWAVLKGATNLLRDVAPAWIVEVHPMQLKMSGGSEEQLLVEFRRAGYSIEILDRNPNGIYTILANRTPAPASVIPF